MRSLNSRAFVGLAVMVVTMALLLFGAAGTFRYWQAWVFLANYIALSLAITLYLMKNDPALLERRMRGGPLAERQPAQRIIMWLVSFGFVSMIAVPALDHRFGWSHMPPSAALAGNGLVLLGWLGIFLVFRENSFASATIEAAADHRVISTGPYAWVRHPMYSAALILLAGIPIALGSWWALLDVVAIVPALVWRLLDEEKFLARTLPGYIEYRRRVRYRLSPLIW
jgi:protein-S-isoprenylcysteine O-methyltransferase Ste14